MTINIRGTQISSDKHATVMGIKAEFQVYLNERYNCDDSVSAAWVIDDNNRAKFGITDAKFQEALNTFINLPEKIEL